MNHKTKTIPLKLIEVDEAIVPVVEWINGKVGAITEFSCQGSSHKSKNFIPDEGYVVFSVEGYPAIGDAVLADILFAIDDFKSQTGLGYVRAEIEWISRRQPFRYVMRFRDKETVVAFGEFVSKAE